MTGPPVLIDGRAAVRSELGGVERWARELAVRLPALNPRRYTVASPPPALAHRAGHLWEQLVLPLRARDAVVLCPANLAPLAARRTVVVIHDAAALREPSWYSRSYVAWQRAVMPRVARRAERIVVPSAFSRAEVIELLGVEPARVSIVPGGVDGRFSPQADAQAARAALGLGDRPYVLTVASRTARKNLAALDRVVGALGAEGLAVVSAGGDRPQFRAEDGATAIRALGHVDDALLPGLYAGAAVFVLPSRYEGFGLPAIEAMASGVPVVAAARGALPEVCGDAARLVDVDDPAALTEAILAAAGDTSLQAAGLARAATFTWERTAQEVDAVVEELVGGQAGSNRATPSSSTSRT